MTRMIDLMYLASTSYIRRSLRESNRKTKVNARSTFRKSLTLTEEIDQERDGAGNSERRRECSIEHRSQLYGRKMQPIQSRAITLNTLLLRLTLKKMKPTPALPFRLSV
jgi:hypothetical protein